jgi:hypothetical protein
MYGKLKIRFVDTVKKVDVWEEETGDSAESNKEIGKVLH